MNDYRDDPSRQLQQSALAQRAAVTFGDDDFPASAPQDRWSMAADQLSPSELARSQSKFMNAVFSWMNRTPVSKNPSDSRDFTAFSLLEP